ncbi:MAG: DinB family protein [Fimbriimonadaceae bacterium]|nr:DinB family protein [Fimbriimonadaceae bacterium]
MSEIQGIANVWQFTRVRLDKAIEDLTEEQWAWRAHPQSHSIAELVMHIAGAEFYWWSRIINLRPSSGEYDERLDRAVIDGYLQPTDFPYRPEELTPDFVLSTLRSMYGRIDELFRHATDSQLAITMTSPVGDTLSGYGGLTRLSQHAGYHTGQIWFIRMMPGFP